MSSFIADFRTNWLVYLSMPVIAALIGYVTKLVAIRMMFQPLEFTGIRPFLGWQGIVPRRAARMAGIAVDTMTRQLISPAEIVERLDADRVAKELEKPLLDGVEEIVREVAAQFQPGLWDTIPETVRRRIIHRVQAEAPELVRSLMDTIKHDVDAVFDLKGMVVSNLVRDKALLNRIFQHAGRKEFQFIARSGIVFGFTIGFVQMFAWAALKNPWVMPIFGGLTGWFTDWLALRMIFNPKQPKRYFGLFEWQGLFLKRRAEVATDYGDLIAREIITPKNVIEAVVHGPLSDRLFALIAHQVQSAMDKQSGPARPLVVLAVGSGKYQAIKQAIAAKVVEKLPETMTYIESYAEDAMDIRNTLVEKMQEMTEEEFESLIRPAFEQDEWILITVGAVLGFAVGELQVVLVENLAR
jgi:uncharacterized membrane protein YheB (UPF0754 family)